MSATDDVLNDDLSDFFNDFGIEPGTKIDRVGDLIPLSKAIAPMYSQPCGSCRGTGKFHARYSGRLVGTCFKCNGTGTLVFKMSPEKRTAARKSYQDRKQKRVEEVRSSADQWKGQHVEVTSWLNANSATFEFAASLSEALNKYGQLTPGQLAAVERILEKNKIRDAERAAAKEKAAAAAPQITVEAIEQSFNHARDKGIKRPKLRLDTFKFSMAPDSGRNAGSIYVIENEQYLGKVTNGKFFRVRECNDATELRIIEVAADPKQAAIAYGKRYGSCSCCGRELTNHASIDLGIGPICAEKYGW